jgi:hypothetical protein
MLSRLYTLLLIPAVAVSSVATFGPWGVAVAACILVSAACIRRFDSPWRAVAAVLLIVLCGACLFWLLSPAIGRMTYANWNLSHRNKLKMFAMALQRYHDTNGCYPPSHFADKDGQPAHSWRVLILPYLEHESLFKCYDFKEPWDGPNNCKLPPPCDFGYVCDRSPIESPPPNSDATEYAAVIGSQTAWPGGRSVKRSDLPHNGRRMILVVEASNCGFEWREPKDLTFDQALAGVNHDPGPGISSSHLIGDGYFAGRSGAYAAFVDGSARFLPNDISRDDLQSLLVGDTARAIDLDALERPIINWPHVVGLSVWITAVGLMVHLAVCRKGVTSRDPRQSV